MMAEDAGAMRVEEHAAPPPEWDDFVRQAPGGTFCHLSGWRAVMEDALGHESHWLVARAADGAWTGVLPLVRVRSRLFGDYLLSMPFLNDGGPVGSPAARSALASRAAERAREEEVDLLELRVREDLAELQVSLRKITVILDLPADTETAWEGLKSKVRSQVRRPRKEGLTYRQGPEHLEPFYEIFTRNMRDLGTPALPRSVFERIREQFPEEAVFGAVYDGDRAVAGSCGFAFGDEFETTWASSLREYSRQAPNMLLYWSLMEHCIERGIRRFNFGRCTPGSGTHRFKSQWGGRDVPLPWGQWSPSGMAATPSPDRPLFQLATRVWSKLPLEVTNVLGPFLARRLP